MPDIPQQPRKHMVSSRERDSFLAWLRQFLGERRTLILATCSPAGPTCNLMSFALASAECSLLLATPAETAKCDTMRAHPAVSLMALDLPALEQDLEQGTAVTLEGEAREILESGERERQQRVFAKANPRLEDFVRSSGTALFRVDLRRVVSVTHFQQLSELVL